MDRFRVPLGRLMFALALALSVATLLAPAGCVGYLLVVTE
jgi:hypothetical protein